MTSLEPFFQKHRHTLVALGAAAVCFAVFLLCWFVSIRGLGTKALSDKVSDDYSAYLPMEDSVSQSFVFDEDLLAMAFVFGIEGEQPSGTIDLVLTDADTGKVLAQSQGVMDNILPGQYTGLGLDTAVAGTEGRHYLVTLTPHYEGSGRLSIGCSATATLWQETLTVDGQTQDATAALLVTYRQIGGFLTRYYWLICLLLLAIVFFGVRSALRRRVALHRLVFALILALGVAYTMVLPPYGAPDEKYHINQSFTLACRWANVFSSEDWDMGHVPINMSYRREHDFDTVLQDQEEHTTVWTWQAFADGIFTLSPDDFDSHTALEEAQTDSNPILYLPSAAAVFVGFLLHLGFVPVLVLGRLANLVCFAALAAAAVRFAPFGRRIFAAVALLPMTLHLAASFSRDALLLGLCFVFTSLCLRAAFGEKAPGRALLLAIAAAGLLFCPGKAVYLPLAALVLLISSKRLALPRPVLWKAGYLAACVVLTLCMNGSMLRFAVSGDSQQAAAADGQETVQLQESSAAETETEPAIHGAPSAGEDTSGDTGDAGTSVGLSEDESAAESALTIREDLTENTVENYVRRLFWYVEGTEEPPAAEVTFWADALQNGDVTAAMLAQSFFFSPEEMEASSLSDEDYIRALYLCLLDRAPTDDEMAGQLSTLQGYGRVMCFKAAYSYPEAISLLESYGVTMGIEDDTRYPMDREELAQDAEAAAAVRENQSIATGDDAICYTPGYILSHPVDTLRLLVRTVIENTDHYIRTLVGGSLGYYTLDLAWGWVIVLYLLLAWAMLPAADHPLAGRMRAGAFVLVLLCCALSVAGCLTWTPTYSETLYGLQGRYFLPVLPLGLLCLAPRRIRVSDAARAESGLVCALCLANAGVLLNAMLAVVAQ